MSVVICSLFAVALFWLLNRPSFIMHQIHPLEQQPDKQGGQLRNNCSRRSKLTGHQGRVTPHGKVPRPARKGYLVTTRTRTMQSFWRGGGLSGRRHEFANFKHHPGHN
jgi:hypothetical protein